MTEKEVLVQLNQVLTSFFKRNIEVLMTSTADEVEGWDSFTHMSLIAEIEKNFNIKFSFADILNHKNIGDLVKSIQSKF